MNRIEQDFEVARLIARSLTDSLSDEERRWLDAWRSESAAHETLYARLCSESALQQHAAQRLAFDEAEGWAGVQRRLNSRRRRQLWMRCASVAAIVLLPLCLAGWLWWSAQPEPIALPMEVAQEICPGSAHAWLTLDDGETVSLQHQTDTLLREGGATVARLDSACLSYAPQTLSSPSQMNHTVETPRGGEYTLLQRDGTRVHLNAMSSLRYPVAGGGERREVELTGEAYFEVSRSETPFVVRTQCMEVEVLGTQFNLSAYPDEASQATLVSGRVKVRVESGESCLLEPSQQATWMPDDHRLSIATVETDFYTSWIAGKIRFKDQRLEEIMKILSRWYGVETHYADERLKELRFGCHLNRYADITPFLHLLERTGKLHVRQQGRHLYFSF